MTASFRTWARVPFTHHIASAPYEKLVSRGLAEGRATASSEHTFILNYVPTWTLLGKHCKLLLLPLKMPFESKRAPIKWGQIKTTRGKIRSCHTSQWDCPRYQQTEALPAGRCANTTQGQGRYLPQSRLARGKHIFCWEFAVEKFSDQPEARKWEFLPPRGVHSFLTQSSA